MGNYLLILANHKGLDSRGYKSKLFIIKFFLFTLNGLYGHFIFHVFLIIFYVSAFTFLFRFGFAEMMWVRPLPNFTGHFLSFVGHHFGIENSAV